MALTEPQQRQCEQHRDIALALARNCGHDDEFVSVAELALCKAVERYRPGKLSLKSYVYLTVWRALGTHLRSETRRRRAGREMFLVKRLVDTGDQALVDELDELLHLASNKKERK